MTHGNSVVMENLGKNTKYNVQFCNLLHMICGILSDKFRNIR